MYLCKGERKVERGEGVDKKLRKKMRRQRKISASAYRSIKKRISFATISVQ